MNELENVFLITGTHGDLYLENVIADMEDTKIFTCLDQNGDMFIFCELDETEEEKSWLSIQIKEETEADLLRGDKTVLQAFVRKDYEDPYVLLKLKKEDDSFTESHHSEMTIEMLSSKNMNYKMF